MSAFRARRQVRFAHCDPAGIAYYPRLFELADTVIEDWTAEVIGVPRRVMHLGMGLGLPTVTIEARFASPARLGDMLDFMLLVERVGGSSVDLALAVSREGEQLFAISYRQVLFTMETGRAKDWPADWRARLEGAMTREGAK